MTIAEHVSAARLRLRRAGITSASADLDAELLARHVLQWERASYLTRRDEQPPAFFVTRYPALVERRARREPVTLITGRREFWGLEFEVTPDVLSPRSETELLVEEALAVCRHAGRPPALIADAGTGSGCLAVSLAREFPAARLVATDLSEPALAVARRNARRHGVADRLACVRTDYLAGIGGRFDLIVSNPPYVIASALPALAPEVRAFEPELALSGGADGLDGVRTLFCQAAGRLAPGGWLLVEFGFGQDEEVAAAVEAVPGLVLDHIREDLQGIPRVAIVRRL